ncbi:MAG: NUDIX hydrolase [Saprospiraceae bacterium]|nr:NUDIX hydrolase [Saprospiraceae bacterium]
MVKEATNTEIQGILFNSKDYFEQFIPQFSIDCVIFGFHDNELKVLLSKLPKLDYWSVQGGFIQKEEDIDIAAVRILKDLTSLDNIYLKQFQTFGKAKRSEYSYAIKQVLKEQNIDFDAIPFLQQRFISIGYYSLVDFQKVTPSVNLYFESSAWHDINKLPPLIFDHTEMIGTALETLRQTLDYQLIGFNLMPETFTMKELQRLYETILGEPLKRNNFQEKILNLNILERLEKQFTGGAHKAPYLYCFKTVSKKSI